MKKFTPIHRLNISRALKGRCRTRETKLKIALALRGVKKTRQTRIKMKQRELKKRIWNTKVEKHYQTKHEVKKIAKNKSWPKCAICGWPENSEKKC